MKLIFASLAVLICSLFLAGCGSVSVPTLEADECIESRDAVKQFYSFHFGNEMKFSPENLQLREKYLTADFYISLGSVKGENDVFTTNNMDLPRAFRLGSCKVIDPAKTNVEILMFWRDDNSSRQESIYSEVIKQDGKWLINKVLR